MRPRLAWADLARVVASFWVVMIHVAAVPVVHMKAISLDSWWWSNLYNSASRAAVPLFIMISGALLLNQDTWNTQQFLWRRARKLAVPLVAWTLLYMGWRVLLHGDRFTTIDLTRSLLDGVDAPAYPHLWFLWIIAGLYLVAPVFQPFVALTTPATQAYFAGLWFCASVVAPLFERWSGIHIGFLPNPVVGYIGYFVIGASIQKSLPARLPIRWVIGAVVLYMVGFLITAWGTYSLAMAHGGTVDESLLESLAGNIVLMSLAAFLLLRHVGTASSEEHRSTMPMVAITTISAASFGIYLLHPMVIDVLDLLGFPLDPLPFHAFWYVPVMSIAVFGLSTLATVGFRAARGLKWLMP